MKKWRPESVLDLYNLLLAAFLFGSPWLFGYVNGNARVDAWATGALIALTSVGALIAFADWEEWVNLFLGVWLILAPGSLVLLTPDRRMSVFPSGHWSFPGRAATVDGALRQAVARCKS